MSLSQEKREQIKKLIADIQELMAATPTGIGIMSKTKKTPYHIDETLDRSTPAACSFDAYLGKGKVHLSPTALTGNHEEDVYRFFEAVGHERTHAAVAHKFSPEMLSNKYSARDFMLVNRINEANAVARSFQMCWELKELTGKDRPWRAINGEGYRLPHMNSITVNLFSDTAKLYKQMVEIEKTNGTSGKAMEAAFFARMMQDKPANDRYNDQYLKMLESLFVDPKTRIQNSLVLMPKDNNLRMQQLEKWGVKGFVSPQKLDAKSLGLFGNWNEKNYLKSENGMMDHLLDEKLFKAGVSDKDMARLNRVEHAIEKIRDDMGLKKERGPIILPERLPRYER